MHHGLPLRDNLVVSRYVKFVKVQPTSHSPLKGETGLLDRKNVAPSFIVVQQQQQ